MTQRDLIARFKHIEARLERIESVLSLKDHSQTIGQDKAKAVVEPQDQTELLNKVRDTAQKVAQKISREIVQTTGREVAQATAQQLTIELLEKNAAAFPNALAEVEQRINEKVISLNERVDTALEVFKKMVKK